MGVCHTGARQVLLVLIALVISTMLPDSKAAAPVIPESVTDNLRKRVEYGHVTGVVVGMINAHGRAFFSAGRTHAGTGAEPTTNTLFEIGSISKAFTGTLLAAMIASGEVALTNTVQSLLPESITVPSGSREITLLHLATHRSGLPDNPDNLCSQGLNEILAATASSTCMTFSTGIH